MVVFDTNYLIRHLVQDDPRQSRIVAQVLRKEFAGGRNILLLDIILCETLWVLNSVYNAKRNDLLLTLKGLEEESCFEFENPKQVKAAMARFEKGKADFSDYLILEKSKAIGCRLLTFDRELLKE